ncbi:MAG: alpha/beta fold hydrolase [Gemmatimonadaceae bacterium]
MFPAGRAELQTRFLDLPSGLRIRLVESGENGAPLVVMVPGWGCSAYVFRENFVPLANAGYHCIAVELKGHGLSDKPLDPREYRLEQMRQHLTEILESLGAPAFVCGLSMGAALGAQVAASSPHLVRGIVMASPVGFFGVPGLTLVRMLTPEAITPLLPPLTGRWLIEGILYVVNGRLREITDRDVDEYWAPSQFPEFSIAMRHLLHEFTWDAPFNPPSMPCLLVSGTRDRFMSREGLDVLSRTMPQMTHIKVKDAGHVIYDEAAPIMNDAILSFFKEVEPH